MKIKFYVKFISYTSNKVLYRYNTVYEQTLLCVCICYFCSQFHTKEEEFFSVPHWINYSFYSSSKGCGQRNFRPRIYLSDHLVHIYTSLLFTVLLDSALFICISLQCVMLYVSTNLCMCKCNALLCVLCIVL